MDKKEGKQFLIFHFHLQWIWRGEDCHLDPAGKGKDKNSHQSTFKSGSVAVVFPRRAVSRIRGWGEIDHLGN
jgi:hypothetical protein